MQTIIFHYLAIQEEDYLINQLKINQLLHYLAILIPILAMKKKESKEVFNNKKTSIFSNLIVPNEKPEEKNKE